MRKNKPLTKASHRFETIRKEEVKRILKEMKEGISDDLIPDVCCNVRSALKETVALSDKFLNESLTIASEVSRTCMAVGKRIIDDIAATEPTADDKGRKIRKGIYRHVDKSMSFDVDWTVRYILSNDESLESYSSGGIVPAKRLITVTIYAVNGAINEASLYETLQHEIFHLFERSKMHHNYLDRAAYDHAFEIIKDKDPDDKSIEVMVNRIIYISFMFEQRAFTNGAYQVLMAGDFNDYKDKFATLIENTKLYRWFTACKEYRNKIMALPENDKELTTSLDEYGLTKSDILERADIAINSMVRLIGKVRAMAMIDYQKLHNIKEYVDITPNIITMTKKEFNDKVNELKEMFGNVTNEGFRQLTVEELLHGDGSQTAKFFSQRLADELIYGESKVHIKNNGDMKLLHPLSDIKN